MIRLMHLFLKKYSFGNWYEKNMDKIGCEVRSDAFKHFFNLFGGNPGHIHALANFFSFRTRKSAKIGDFVEKFSYEGFL